MPDSKKNIEAALKDLKSQKVKLERAIRELTAARAERTKVVTAIRDLEHALKTMRRGGGTKPGVKPKTKKKAATKSKAKAKREKRGPKPKKGRKKAAKKKVSKKTDRSKAWTPAKRAAMARKVRAYWAAKKKAEKKAA